MSTAVSQDVLAELRRFGLRQFRPGQREVIEAVLAGEDCLCIMPTGGGKSLCYQLPAVMRAGVTLVVSPLIALMKDQVDGLDRLGVKATYINSTLDSAEQSSRLAAMRAGQFDLVYVAPERFRSPRFIEFVRSTHVQLLAVDEAHCISEWGHDFRPDYARLGQFRKSLANPQTMALTATATPDVRQDVVSQLALHAPKTFIAGFSRPNLHFQVQYHGNRRDKDESLEQFLRQHEGVGIIYTSTRKAAEEVAHMVAEGQRRSVGVYHAGLEMDQRRRVQDDFMAGRLGMVVATNAFGMGIDKADVRFVVHYTIPGSVEAYYQEAGRAGRDGDSATCLLQYCPSDRYVQEFFIESAYPSPESVARVYQFLRDHEEDPVEISQEALRDQLNLGISAEGVGTCERLLEKAGVLKRLEPHRNMAAVQINSDVPTLVDLLPSQAQVRRKVLAALEKLVGQRRQELIYFHPHELADATELTLASVTRALRELNGLAAVDYVAPFRGRAIHLLRRDLEFDQLSIDFASLEKRKAADWEKLNRVIQFAKTRRCRQQELLGYFGEHTTVGCGRCDNCQDGHARSRPTAKLTARTTAEPHAVGEAVRMVLSGVARTRGRFGRHVVVGMLCGSNSAKVTRWKLDKLSTFGLMSSLAQSEVSLLVDALIQIGLLQQTEVDRFRPVLQLTELGTEVMQGKRALDGPLQLPPSLVPKLRALSGHRKTPGSPAAAQGPRGASPPPEKASLAAVSHGPGEKESSRAMHLAGQADNVALVDRPDHYWTWRLLADGYSAQQCAIIRRLAPHDVLCHALAAAEGGLAVQCGWFLSLQQVAALERMVSGEPVEQLLDRMEGKLPGGLQKEHVLLFLKCQLAAGNSLN